MSDTIHGFDIPNRKLTEEEASREITFDRFDEWMCEVGEDFVDQHEFGFAPIFIGFLMHKYPEQSEDLLNIFNNKKQGHIHVSIQEVFNDFYYDTDEMNDYEWFYTDYAEFLNLTKIAKAKVNKQLILVMEHYKK